MGRRTTAWYNAPGEFRIDIGLTGQTLECQGQIMLKNFLILAAILGTIGIAYTMGQNQGNTQVNDLRGQVNNLKTQMDQQEKNLRSSYHRLHRSMNLHMSETSIESAIHETLDQNFGQARIAINSAQQYLKGATGATITSTDIEGLSSDLRKASGQLRQLDKGAVTSLNEADRKVRKLILQNSR